MKYWDWLNAKSARISSCVEADVEYTGSNMEAADHQPMTHHLFTKHVMNEADFVTSSQFYHEWADDADLVFLQTTLLCEQSSQGFCYNTYCTN